MSVLVAPNAFKGSLSAVEAADALAAGVQRALPDAMVRRLPLADGGDGSVAAFVGAGFAPVPVTVRGPTGEAVTTTIAMRDGRAVVELADACGLVRLPDGAPAPLTSSTLGLGDAIVAALDAGADDITVCLGGSASTDGGAGVLVALGARIEDDGGRTLAPDGASLAAVRRLDLSGLDPRLARTRIAVAVDVSAPLHGPQGAAVVFAPQKGATPDDVATLDAGLRSWAGVLHAATGRDVASTPGAGAAGGTAAALLAALDATVEPGAALIAGVTGLDAAIAEADLVVTGEGRLDAQTLLGKGAADVAARCRSAGRPVLAVCGEVALDAAGMRRLGFDAWADCTSRAADAADAQARAGRLVADAAEDLLRGWVR